MQSQTLRDVWYVVRLGTNGLICECPANAGEKKDLQALVCNTLIFEKEWWHRARKKIRIVRHGVRCRYCKSCDVVKNGKRRCKRKQNVQRYKCKSCYRTFSGMDGFRGRHLEKTIIVEALYMVAFKMSANDVRKELKLRGIYVHENGCQMDVWLFANDVKICQPLYKWMQDTCGISMKSMSEF